jgi:recombination protein RecR
VRDCALLRHFSEADSCPICAERARDRGAICVVEDPRTCPAIERTGLYQALIHVLGGALPPLRGIGRRSCASGARSRWLRAGGVREVILAMSPNVEGRRRRLPRRDP